MRTMTMMSDGNGGASSNEVWEVAESEKAISSGQKLRDELNKMSADRQELATKTDEKLKEMNEQLSSIMATLREEIGMPPVADFQSDNDDNSNQSSTSTGTNTSNITTKSSSSSTTSSTTASSSSSSEEVGSSVSDEPYMDPTNFGYESTAGWQVLAESLQLPENEGTIQFRIQCDAHGCSLIERNYKEEGDELIHGVRSKFIQSGNGYRVGFDPEAPKICCALLGGGEPSWTVSLSYEEIRHFKRLSLSLQKKMDRIGTREEDFPSTKDEAVIRRCADGLFNIRLSKVGVDFSVEHESKLLWAQAIGQPVNGQYCIRAIFMEGRKVELYWSPDCVHGLLSALTKLRIE